MSDSDPELPFWGFVRKSNDSNQYYLGSSCLLPAPSQEISRFQRNRRIRPDSLNPGIEVNLPPHPEQEAPVGMDEAAPVDYLLALLTALTRLPLAGCQQRDNQMNQLVGIINAQQQGNAALPATLAVLLV